VIGIGGDQRLGGGHLVAVALGAEHPAADLGLVEPEVQDGVIELANRAQDPGSRARLRQLVAGGRLRLVGRSDRVRRGTQVAIDLDAD
jgi:hypothetical protein